MFSLVNHKFWVPRGVFAVFTRCYSVELENKYSESQKEKILQIINENTSSLSSYDITKARLKNISSWLKNNGQLKSLSDIKSIDGFTEKHADKLFNSLINGPQKKVQNLSKKIKGQILNPHLSETLRQSCKSVVAVFTTVNSVCWALIDRDNYEIQEWKYYHIEYPESNKMQITNILDIAWDVTKKLPSADIYVMKAEASSLRAAGSDPNNPKVLSVNLQKSQLIAMIVALINARQTVCADWETEEKANDTLKQKVFFLRPTLPFRLYGTLVGNERVSTDQTVETLLQEVKNRENNSQVHVPDKLVAMFRNQKDLQKDMLGQCLLLALTFMDVCIYMNKDSINKLLKRGE
ncbi:uncharacterized protein LOC112054613 [Bicyclus anynana]|uniref:Uncharacterized protein LOC112054613 n=1 Tax=Bicyclus anynana TaxID=110368 RepID=A0A6J1NR90_BICAN|nr:uncharacterized protein LOC112054613 [Bicyclus anynana]